MTALEELLRVPHRTENPYIKDWKADGGRVIGFTCSYVPEEIIHASGLLPFRIEARECRDTDLADVYMHRFNCTYARCILQEGLSDRYDFLDGMCLLNGCEQVRRLYEIWEKEQKTDYMYMVTIPHSVYDEGLTWYKDELFNFKEKLTSDFAVRCSKRDLQDSIQVYNETRRLIAELYELRKAEDVPISGSDALRIVLSSYIMPKEEFNKLLKQALEEIRSENGNSSYKARLLVGGSAVDGPELFELIEGMGAMIVTDTLCYGSRQFDNMVAEDQDPLDALAKAYYVSNPCPRMMNEYHNRLKYSEDTAQGASVDGVILQKIVFCDNHAVDSTMLADDLEAKGIPTMVMERDHMLTDTGRLRTRVEAFMERIARR
jgi:benzoyl-CoA reductase subunit C